MLGLALGMSGDAAPRWWPDNAVYAADFINQRYMRNGAPIAWSDAVSFARGSTKWAANGAGQWQMFGPGVPALTDLGLSIEPAGTNLVPNPGLAGAAVGVVGADGSLPTGWFHNGTLTTEVVTVTSLLGLPALHVRISGVASGTFYELGLMPANTPMAPSTTYTASVFMQSLAGSSPIIQLRQAASGDAQVTGLSLATYNGTSRFGISFESNLGTVQSRLRLAIVTVPAQNYLFEIVLASPQVELGPVATSPLFGPRVNDELRLQLPGNTSVISIASRDGSTTVPPDGAYHLVSPSAPFSPLRSVRGIN